ncbi:hypothetical protein N7478_001348 [Penicillium angulare]|uniref:uncharacterized protein n=1 Tax=Penicillium angulare TaxID=116970 RepID=UPI0025411B8A|nr:uncharacterized protein N7478_001348 [Penicillium angulare]KAJ5292097.1 hypothetical protein N7478_001348 [Penicillium angulare]
MSNIDLNLSHLDELNRTTAIVTGAAGGIGGEIVRLLVANGSNVVMADLAHCENDANSLIASLPHPTRAHFVPTNITKWDQITTLFRTAKDKFGSVEVVIANAGVMEKSPILDVEKVDQHGNLAEDNEFSKVIDINIKGTMNTLRQAIFHMKDNKPTFSDGSRGSILLVSSTSGYFGGTGVTGYITSKHGVTGMLRGSQLAASKHLLRINAVAPFVTPTAMSSGFATAWKKSGLPMNTMEAVARVIAVLAADPLRRGSCYLTCGPIIREVETSQKSLMGEWLGNDFVELMASASRFFADQGGYTLPKLIALDSSDTTGDRAK